MFGLFFLFTRCAVDCQLGMILHIHQLAVVCPVVVHDAVAVENVAVHLEGDSAVLGNHHAPVEL